MGACQSGSTPNTLSASELHGLVDPWRVSPVADIKREVVSRLAIPLPLPLDLVRVVGEYADLEPSWCQMALPFVQGCAARGLPLRFSIGDLTPLDGPIDFLVSHSNPLGFLLQPGDFAVRYTLECCDGGGQTSHNDVPSVELVVLSASDLPAPSALRFPTTLLCTPPSATSFAKQTVVLHAAVAVAVVLLLRHLPPETRLVGDFCVALLN